MTNEITQNNGKQIYNRLQSEMNKNYLKILMGLVVGLIVLIVGLEFENWRSISRIYEARMSDKIEFNRRFDQLNLSITKNTEQLTKNTEQLAKNSEKLSDMQVEIRVLKAGLNKLDDDVRILQVDMSKVKAHLKIE